MHVGHFLDEKLTAKLSDFGFSIQLPKSMGSKTLITSADGLPGTDGYRPPEYADQNCSVLSDMYSYGVVRLQHHFPTYIFVLSWWILHIESTLQGMVHHICFRHGLYIIVSTLVNYAI